MASKTLQTSLLGVVALVMATRGAVALFERHYVTSLRHGGIVDQWGTPAIGVGIAYMAMGTGLLAAALYQYESPRRIAVIAGALSVVTVVTGFAVGLIA